MATTVIGDIAGPITDGGGAPAVTVDVINAMWANAQSKAQAGKENVDYAIDLAGAAPSMVAPAIDQGIAVPAPPLISWTDPNQGEAIYQSTAAEILATIQSGFTNFLTTYFGDPVLFAKALAWCESMLTSGGSGINPGVEAAIWERERARTQLDTDRQVQEAEMDWSGRGFPIPPGMLTNQVNQIRLDGARRNAEASRSAAIESFKVEVENVRFAVTTVIDQRKVAMDAAGNYIRTLIMGPQTAMQLATGLAGLQTEFARAQTALYQAQTAALDPVIRLRTADADLKVRASEANLRAQSANTEQRVRAALQGAQMLASTASAGINAINAGTSISGSDSSSV